MAFISADEYFEYFEGCNKGLSIEVAEINSFSVHVQPRKIWQDFVIPQSFKYLAESEFDEILAESAG